VRPDRLHRLLSALLVAPLLALAVSASSFSGLRCSMSGLFIPESCCPAADQAADAAAGDRHASIEDPACCERVIVANAKAPAASPDRLQLAPPAADLLSAALLQPRPLPGPRAARLDLPSAAHGRASPVFLLTQSFLI
jgi:hypothetical protein